MAASAAEHQLLFGLFALQIGLVRQEDLLTAFRMWTRDKTRKLADFLVEQGSLEAADRAVIEAIVVRHVDRHGGDAEKSLAVLEARPELCQSLAAIGDAELGVGITLLTPATEEANGERTRTYGAGSIRQKGRGSACSGLTPGAGWGRSSSPGRRAAPRGRAQGDPRRHADDPASRPRFLLEAEVTGGLEHPGIVPVYGLGGYADGRPYYAMRFIRGEASRRRSSASTPTSRSRPTRAAGRRAPQAPAAIPRRLQRDRVRPQPRRPASRPQAGQHHGRQVRRDPGRRLGTGQGRSGTAEPAATDERTLMPVVVQRQRRDPAGHALGTPAYMSPEQAAGDLDRLGPRSTSTAWARRSTAC